MIAPPEVVLPRPSALRVGISCFSTLGCPELTLGEAVDLARQFNVQHLELRALENSVDLPRIFSQYPGGCLGARQFLRSLDLTPRILGTSFKLIGHTPDQWDELFAFAHLAQDLETPWLRVFSGGTWGMPLTAADYETACSAVRRWRREKARRGWNTDILVETHDAFSASAPCQQLLESLDQPVDFIWDTHHTWRLGGEAPMQTWEALAPYIRHIHIKDSTDTPSARHPYTYVLPGEGQMPLSEVFALLARNAFPGTISLEWEKMWHPYLPPLAEALSACQQKGWL